MHIYIYIYLIQDVAESQPIVSRDILTSSIWHKKYIDRSLSFEYDNVLLL